MLLGALVDANADCNYGGSWFEKQRLSSLVNIKIVESNIVLPTTSTTEN